MNYTMGNIETNGEGVSIAQIQERYDKQYASVRGVNQLLSSLDFRLNTGPYPIHVAYDQSQQMLWIEGDNTFSWIDIKSTDFHKAYTKLVKIIEEINNPDSKENNGIASVSQASKDTAHNIFAVIVGKVTEDKKRRRPKVTIDFPNKKYHTILRKLYTDTVDHKGELWTKKKTNGKETVSLNEEGEKYFSHIFTNLYSYYTKTKFLGSDRESRIFPHGTFIDIRSKVQEGELFTTNEICQLIYHLIDSNNVDDLYDGDKVKGHHAKGLKKLMINQLWAMLYDEQIYSYYTIGALSQGRSDRQSKDKDIIEKLSIDSKDLYTESGYKGLASLGSKELRRASIEDMLRSRTWISDDKLNKGNVQIIFMHQIEQLKKHFEEQGYEVIIDNIEVVNKFKGKGKQGINLVDDVTDIEDGLKIMLTEDSKREHSPPGKKNSSVYTYDVSKVTHIDIATQGIIRDVIDRDGKLTGGNGIYEDIKMRVGYRLQDKKGEEIIGRTGGYEHMIVNMGSVNECGLSDHNIILDPKKTIVNMIRTKSHIGIDEFKRLVSGGLDTTIKQLLKWKRYLGGDIVDEGEANFIKIQYPLRDTIPEEILNLANAYTNEEIPKNTYYTNLDTQPAIKKRIENAIATHILNDLLGSGMIQWYFYDDDAIDGLNEKIQQGLKGKMYFSQEEREEVTRKALKSRYQNEYRMCGAGGGNFLNSMRNGTLKPEATIGIPHNGSIMYIKVATLAGILSDATTVNTGDSVKIESAEAIMKVMSI